MFWCFLSSHFFFFSFFLELRFKFSFRVLIQNFCFGTNLLLIKFVAICVTPCSLILHDIAWRCPPLRNQLWKEIVAREKKRWLILTASPLSRRRLDHQQDFMMPISSNHIPHIKLMWTTSRMPPCWLKVWLRKLLFSIWTFQNGLPPRIGTIFYPTLKICTKSLWKKFLQMPFLMGMNWDVG